MSPARFSAVILILIASACGKHTCDDQWETMDRKRDGFLAAYNADHSTTSAVESEAVAAFGDPTVKGTLSGGSAEIWRWDISTDGDACGKWWVEFPPATIAVGREDAFPYNSDRLP